MTTHKSDHWLLVGLSMLSIGLVVLPLALILYACAWIFKWPLFYSLNLEPTNKHPVRQERNPVRQEQFKKIKEQERLYNQESLVCPQCETSQFSSHCKSCGHPTVTMSEYLVESDWS
jgi:hypothetical protein